MVVPDEMEVDGAAAAEQQPLTEVPVPVSEDSVPTSEDDEEVYEKETRTEWDQQSFRRHLVLPHIISGYLQLSFNIVMISFIMYALASFVSSIHGDIDTKVSEYSGTIVNEIAECLNNHRLNRCGTADEVPALRATCAMWERCMSRDPTTVARTKLSAHTIGEILNNFVEPLSYKAMAFFTLFLFCFVLASNLALRMGASKPVVATANALLPDWSDRPERERREPGKMIRARRKSRDYRRTPASAELTRY